VHRLILLIGLSCLFCVPALAQTATPATPTIAPMVMEAPLRGIVTVGGGDGCFNSSIGQVDYVNLGAEVIILRGNMIIGRGQVIRLNRLDSVVKLFPEFGAARVLTGDTVLVRYNPPAAVECDLPLGEDFMEPDKDIVAVFTLAVIYGIAEAIFD
jgi:hypothetical protein